MLTKYLVLFSRCSWGCIGNSVEFFPHAYYSGILNTSIVKYSRTYGKLVGVVDKFQDTEMAMVL